MGEFWPYETNLEKAREALAQSKFAGGFEVNVPVYAGDVFDEEINVLLRENLSPLGIKLNLQKSPSAKRAPSS